MTYAPRRRRRRAPTPAVDGDSTASALDDGLGVTIPNELVTELSDDGTTCVFTLTQRLSAHPRTTPPLP
jgi:hypothetical protein